MCRISKLNSYVQDIASCLSSNPAVSRAESAKLIESDGAEDQGAEEAFMGVYAERELFRQFWKPSPVAQGSPFNAQTQGEPPTEQREELEAAAARTHVGAVQRSGGECRGPTRHERHHVHTADEQTERWRTQPLHHRPEGPLWGPCRPRHSPAARQIAEHHPDVG